MLLSKEVASIIFTYVFIVCFVNLDKSKVDRYKEKHAKDGRLESNSLAAVNGESKHKRRSRSVTDDDSTDEIKHHRHRKHKKTDSDEKHRERNEHRHKSGDKTDRRCDEERKSDTDSSRRRSSKHKHSHKTDKRQSSDSELRQQKRKHDVRWEFI